MSKTHWKKFHNPDYLGSYAFDPGQEPVLTIKSVAQEDVMGQDGKKEPCMVAHFAERDVQPMILNVTNCKTIAAMYGNYVEDWAGKKIKLYVAQVNAFGNVWDALRIRPKAPVTEREELTPGHKRWAGAVESIARGETSVEVVKKHFILSEADEAALKQAVLALRATEAGHA